ncbi:MAG: hypothetical protein JW819_10850, partial [Candidatus Krumholzibacteriota bacterium]|nr:hypothetical protein [Candidatus Krumholzibacteriota bacterium]
MESRRRLPARGRAALLALALAAAFATPAPAWREVTPHPSESEMLLGTKVLDGRFVHRVGRLQMNVT